MEKSVVSYQDTGESEVSYQDIEWKGKSKNE